MAQRYIRATQQSRNVMPSRSKSSKAAEIAHIEELIDDLEKRLRRLNNSAHQEAAGASDDVGQFVSEAIERIITRARDQANSFTEQAADRASKASLDAYKRVIDEVESYPLATVAVAAGIGFLLGASRR
jgi:ElaB/YqjD/DUF883 family membrane-anchored ribosome-binding protein